MLRSLVPFENNKPKKLTDSTNQFEINKIDN